MAGTIGRFRVGRRVRGKRRSYSAVLGRLSTDSTTFRTAFPAAHELDDPYLIPTPWVHTQRQLPTLRAVPLWP